MRFHLPFGERFRRHLSNRDWFGIGLELLTVVVGVLLGLQASQWAAERQERAYRRQIIAALGAFILNTTVCASGVSIAAMSAKVALRVETTPAGGSRKR